MKNWSTLVLLWSVITVLGGCGQTSQPEPELKPAQVQRTESPPTYLADEAKTHVQQYIDRLLGGDQTVRQGLLGIDGVSFDSIESIQITSALPAYLPDGKKIENMVRIVLNVQGYDALKKRSLAKNVDLHVRLKDGQWSILGSNL